MIFFKEFTVFMEKITAKGAGTVCFMDLPNIGTPAHIDPFIGTLRNAHQKRLTAVLRYYYSYNFY